MNRKQRLELKRLLNLINAGSQCLLEDISDPDVDDISLALHAEILQRQAREVIDIIKS